MRKIYSTIAALLLVMTLTACIGGNNSGSTNSPGSNTGAVNQEPGTVKPDESQQTEKEGNGEGSADAGSAEPDQPEQQDQQEQPEQPKQPVEPPTATKDIELEVEGMKESREGTLAESDNGYYMYTLPNFTFTPEEPGVDQVYMTSFNEYYMRIQALGADVDVELMKGFAEEELKASGGEVSEKKGDSILDPELRKAEFYLHSQSDELIKDIVMMKVDGQFFKITIHLPHGEPMEGAEPSILAMIKTVYPAQ